MSLFQIPDVPDGWKNCDRIHDQKCEACSRLRRGMRLAQVEMRLGDHGC